jgi:hypothetical protein
MSFAHCGAGSFTRRANAITDRTTPMKRKCPASAPMLKKHSAVGMCPAGKPASLNPRPQPTDGPAEPRPARPQMEPDEPDQRHDEHPAGHVEPTKCGGELGWGLRPHHTKLTRRKGSDSHAEQREDQACVRRAPLEPDQQMDRRQRYAGRRHH